MIWIFSLSWIRISRCRSLSSALWSMPIRIWKHTGSILNSDLKPILSYKKVDLDLDTPWFLQKLACSTSLLTLPWRSMCKNHPHFCFIYSIKHWLFAQFCFSYAKVVLLCAFYCIVMILVWGLLGTQAIHAGSIISMIWIRVQSTNLKPDRTIQSPRQCLIVAVSGGSIDCWLFSKFMLDGQFAFFFFLCYTLSRGSLLIGMFGSISNCIWSLANMNSGGFNRPKISRQS